MTARRIRHGSPDCGADALARAPRAAMTIAADDLAIPPRPSPAAQRRFAAQQALEAEILAALAVQRTPRERQMARLARALALLLAGVIIGGLFQCSVITAGACGDDPACRTAPAPFNTAPAQLNTAPALSEGTRT